MLARIQAANAATSAAASADPASGWFAHVEALASDEMRGRETGSPEHRKAADYVAEHFKQAGPPAAGSSGYLQPVFRSEKSTSRSPAGSRQGGQARPVALGDEATFGMRIDPAPSVDAPLVFAGHGSRFPEAKHDDFAALDVKGKVVVCTAGSRRRCPGR